MKKVAFIDHSYHIKTKSSAFMIDFLRKFYEVELVFNDQWNGGEAPDLKHLDERYTAVIFWQSITPELVQQVACTNVIFFPMYDDSGGMPESFWRLLGNIRVISFSKTLYMKLKAFGMSVMYLQHYPECEALPSREAAEGLHVFFWQRRNELTWNSVRVLLAENPAIRKVHIHRSVDPGQTFVQPSAEDEARYSITYSDWFETHEDYLDMVRECDIYIAPRMYEGIGFSFLEAMAMGKAVVATDLPTMNEYILDGINGYLFSMDDLHPVDFSNIKLVQKNAYGCVAAGRAWLKQRECGMIRFIEAGEVRHRQVSQDLAQPVTTEIGGGCSMGMCKYYVKLCLPPICLIIYRKLRNWVS